MVNRASTARVVPLLQPGDRRQAAYYRSELDERLTRIEGEIAEHFVALGVFQGQGYVRGLCRVSQAIRDGQKEQFELHRLRDALEHRFFPSLATRVRTVHCFDAEIIRDGSWWKIYIPAMDELTKARHRGEVEMTAREHIAFGVATPIAEVAVRIVGGPF